MKKISIIIILILTPVIGFIIISPTKGCTDPTSFNYNPEATKDDNSCIPIIKGCTCSAASNYNETANTDDGSCLLINTINKTYANEGTNVLIDKKKHDSFKIDFIYNSSDTTINKITKSNYGYYLCNYDDIPAINATQLNITKIDTISFKISPGDKNWELIKLPLGKNIKVIIDYGNYIEKRRINIEKNTDSDAYLHGDGKLRNYLINPRKWHKYSIQSVGYGMPTFANNDILKGFCIDITKAEIHEDFDERFILTKEVPEFLNVRKIGDHAIAFKNWLKYE
jgi:hypothetical protein